MRTLELGPQPGPQTDFLSSAADVVIFGGSAGGGKSYGLLLEPLRHCQVPGFAATIFRRTTKQVRNKGGLWDTAMKIYGRIPGMAMLQTQLTARFPGRAHSEVVFAHLEYEKNIYDYDGAQFALLGFDELQHFTRQQFRYLLSRNRSACGVPSYCRATCNPDPDSWILELIDWYISAEGLAIPERCGRLRYFFTHNDRFVTGATKEELREKYKIDPSIDLRTVTFIRSSLEDNPALTKADPLYRANLEMQSEAERARLLDGNWKVRKQGKMFKRAWFKQVEPDPARSYERVVVGVDPSGGVGAGHDAQGIVSVAQGRDGNFYVLTDATCSLSPSGWGRMAIDTFRDDQADCIVAEGNYGGDMVISTIQIHDPYAPVKKVTASRGKAVRAEPIASLYEKGLVFHVGAKPELENELAGFDPQDRNQRSPNRLDALVWAFTELLGEKSNALDYLRYLDDMDAQGGQRA